MGSFCAYSHNGWFEMKSLPKFFSIRHSSFVTILWNPSKSIYSSYSSVIDSSIFLPPPSPPHHFLLHSNCSTFIFIIILLNICLLLSFFLPNIFHFFLQSLSLLSLFPLLSLSLSLFFSLRLWVSRLDPRNSDILTYWLVGHCFGIFSIDK